MGIFALALTHSLRVGNIGSYVMSTLRLNRGNIKHESAFRSWCIRHPEEGRRRHGNNNRQGARPQQTRKPRVFWNQCPTERTGFRRLPKPNANSGTSWENFTGDPHGRLPASKRAKSFTGF